MRRFIMRGASFNCGKRWSNVPIAVAIIYGSRELLRTASEEVSRAVATGAVVLPEEPARETPNVNFRPRVDPRLVEALTVTGARIR